MEFLLLLHFMATEPAAEILVARWSMLDAGCWMLDTRYLILDTRCWMLDTGCW